MSTRLPSRRPLLAFLPLLLVACTAAAVPSGSPGPTRSPTAPVGDISHATGATDVVLRLEEGGGFVPVEFLVLNGPIFTLYGDGTVIFRNVMEQPPAGEDATRGVPYRTARLNEDQVQSLLDFALSEGGLAIARARYDQPNVADAPTATFTLRAGGLDKTVSVNALGFEAPDDTSPDLPARKAFQRLAERLREFDTIGGVVAVVYRPDRYRALLWEPGGVPQQAARAWPWPEIKVSEFVAAGEGFGFPRRTMSAADAAKLGIDRIEGGVQGLFLKASDDKIYSFALRPLLPDEAG